MSSWYQIALRQKGMNPFSCMLYDMELVMPLKRVEMREETRLSSVPRLTNLKKGLNPQEKSNN